MRYFARIREITGLAEETLELPPDADTAALYTLLTTRYADLEGMRGHLRVARNLEFVDWDTALVDGDEIAFIPPVSGGDGSRFIVTTDPLSLDAVIALVRRPQAGAIATFCGVVRDHTGDRDVVRLEYDAYVPMARAKLREVAEQAASRWPVRVAVHHRHGSLDVGELAVVIAVSSPHRAEAFEACRFVIEQLKRDVPIWKKEISADGSEWIGRGS